jgi:sortase (surface protein transpeptidase)
MIHIKYQRITLYVIVGAITIFALLLFSWTLIHTAFYFSDSGSAGIATTPTLIQPAEDASATSSPGGISGTYPAYVAIPSLGVSASVQRLGLNSKGNVGAPSNFVDVGWYVRGPIPGQVGSAIIDGHVDNGLGLAGVFKHLSSIAIGDSVYVTDHKGTVLRFVVTDVQSFNDENAPLDAIFNQDNGMFLKLITCGGTWIPSEKAYDQRVVVTSVLASIANAST